MTADRPRFPRTVWVLGGALLALIAVAAWWVTPQIERALAAEGTVVLGEAGSPLTVIVDGRDAMLSGVAVESVQIDEAARLVASVPGVRSVDLAFVRIAGPAHVEPTVTIRFDGLNLVLEGRVPDDATRARLTTAAAGHFGEDWVVNDLGLDPATVRVSWLERVPQIFPVLGAWERGTIVITREGIEIDGVVASEDSAPTLVERLAAATQMDVAYHLVVIEAAGAPSLQISVGPTGASIVGALPTAEDVDAVLGAFSADVPVTNGLVAGAVQQAPWVDRVPAVVAALSGWPTWSLAITPDGASVSGRAPDPADVEDVRRQVLAAAGIAFETEDLEVDAEALSIIFSEMAARTVTFEQSSAVLDASSRDVLDEVATLMRANPSAAFVVEGYTDDQGRTYDNLQLSHLRAQAVVDLLVDLGVRRTRLKANGFGEARPVASNETAEGRAWNRRIEFSVWEVDE